MRVRIEKRVLGQRARRDQAHHVFLEQREPGHVIDQFLLGILVMSQITTSITTCGDAFSPQKGVSSDQKKRTPATVWSFIQRRKTEE